MRPALNKVVLAPDLLCDALDVGIYPPGLLTVSVIRQQA